MFVVFNFRRKEGLRKFPELRYSQMDNRKRKYLSENLSISRMHLLYLEKYELQVKEAGDKPQVKEWLYRKIFRPWSHYVWNLAANRQSNDDGRGFGRSCGHTARVQNGYRSV